MRVLGFSRRWEKLARQRFTTFRFARKDRDWEVGEVVQIVLKPRSPEREVLGLARIVAREPRRMARHGSRLPQPIVTEEEAREDGFTDYFDMWEWLFDVYGGERLLKEPMNKLTLVWVSNGAGRR